MLTIAPDIHYINKYESLFGILILTYKREEWLRKRPQNDYTSIELVYVSFALSRQAKHILIYYIYYL
jgi:hypothetical protein